MIDIFLSRVQDACDSFGSQITIWEGRERQAGNIFRLGNRERSLLLYVKESNEFPGFWGLSPNILGQLERSGSPWIVLLLSNTPSVAYICTPAEVRHRAGTLWGQAIHGDYKIHENAQIIGIPSLTFPEAADFLAHLVGRSDTRPEPEYQSLTAGSLRTDQVAFCIARLPGSGKRVARLAVSRVRSVDLLASFGALLLGGGSTLGIMGQLLPIFAAMLEVLSDDEALLVRAIIELSGTGPSVPERLILEHLNTARVQRQLRPLSSSRTRKMLVGLEEKGYVLRSISGYRWMIADLAL
ncbi:hypothetical protein [Longimicrobium sp.]|jgi:hypothetical protein|uniref:hypothetical protein n=1 Tax=Longimicrobium sp. TaxID=2029185 RepID=UPI002EDA8BA0